MTIIYIENVLGSGQIVTVAETFKTRTVERHLRPGENGRFFTSAFKSIVVNETMVAASDASPLEDAPYVPIKLTMSLNDN
jgi:hypothetical protein